MAVKGINGPAVAMTGGGVLFLWSAMKGRSVLGALREVMSGKQPTAAADYPVAGQSATDELKVGSDIGQALGSASVAGATAAQNQATAKLLAQPYGWSSGGEWDALVKLWNQESSWSNTAMNQSSHAFGIAQALDHGGNGTGGTYGNQYPNKAANNGDPGAQISWGLSYIKGRYGSPSAAWAHEVSAGWY